jgi:hypothetical protein
MASSKNHQTSASIEKPPRLDRNHPWRALDEGRDRVLTIPWTQRSSHPRREIIHAINAGDQPVSRMRSRARQVFVDAMRDAHD